MHRLAETFQQSLGCTSTAGAAASLACQRLLFCTLQVKRRPTPLALRDFHTAAGKLLRSTSADGISGADAAAAAQSLAELLLQDKTLKGSARSIALITDRLYPAEDFATFLQVRFPTRQWFLVVSRVVATVAWQAALPTTLL